MSESIDDLVKQRDELLSALKRAEQCIYSAIRVESSSYDEPPYPVSEWDYNADILVNEIQLIIAKFDENNHG